MGNPYPPITNDTPRYDHLRDALSALSERLARFSQAGGREPLPPLEKQRDDYIGKLIMERDESFSVVVASKYAQYKEPFKTLGEDSIVARRIAADERYLLAAYNLFKAAKETEDEVGKGITYLKDTRIISPLAARAEYTTGEEFVYLRAYLVFEQLVTDYAPQFEQVRDGSFVLTFVKPTAVRETYKTREIFAAIKAAYREVEKEIDGKRERDKKAT